MSHSPTGESDSREYDQAWQAINELIREGGSWSGRERNNFYLNLGEGRFVEASSSFGLDHVEDGRASAFWDFDGDGDVDLLLKNRNGPQLRLLRNDIPTPNHHLWVELEGTTDNRDAVGASVRVSVGGEWRSASVTSGAGFLSQSSRRLHFGLGSTDTVDSVIVRWPDGTEQRFPKVRGGRRIRLRQGRDSIEEFPTVEPTSGRRSGALPAPAEVRGHSWLSRPTPAPDFQLVDLEGGLARRSDFEGSFVLVNFWATWCGPCRGELQSWAGQYEAVSAAGVRVLAISVDDPAEAERVREFRDGLQLPFPVAQADEELVRRFNVFYRSLFVRKSDMQIPTTLLLAPSGEVLKVYRGAADIETVLDDVHSVRNGSTSTLHGVPYDGRSLAFEPVRDEFELGTGYLAEGLFRDAVAVLERVVAADPAAAEGWNNLGAAYRQLGRLEQAREAFGRAVETRPDYIEGWLNLGAVLRSLGRAAQARDALVRAVGLSTEERAGQIQLAVLESEMGRVEEAIRLGLSYLSRHPRDAGAHNSVGVFHAQQGQIVEAAAAFRRATQLEPSLGQAWVNLGRAQLQSGQFSEAVATLEKAVELLPEEPPVHYFLAQAYVGNAQPAAARRSLERVLELDASSGPARRMLESLGPSKPREPQQ